MMIKWLFLTCWVWFIIPTGVRSTCLTQEYEKKGTGYDCDVMVDGHRPASLYLEFNQCLNPASVYIKFNVVSLGIDWQRKYGFSKQLQVPIYGVGILSVQKLSNNSVYFEVKPTTDSKFMPSITLPPQLLIEKCDGSSLQFPWYDVQSIALICTVGLICLFIYLCFYFYLVVKCDKNESDEAKKKLKEEQKKRLETTV